MIQCVPYPLLVNMWAFQVHHKVAAGSQAGDSTHLRGTAGWKGSAGNVTSFPLGRVHVGSLLHLQMGNCLKNLLWFTIWESAVHYVREDTSYLTVHAAPSLLWMWLLVNTELKWKIYYDFYLCVCVSIWVQVRCVWVSTEVRRGHYVSWSWSYRHLWAALWVLETTLVFWKSRKSS